MCPSQQNTLLSALGAIDPLYDRMITFDIDKVYFPRLPPFVTFQVPITIKNIIIHRCIIDEGASTCVMSTHVWKNLGSPKPPNNLLILSSLSNPS